MLAAYLLSGATQLRVGPTCTKGPRPGRGRVRAQRRTISSARTGCLLRALLLLLLHIRPCTHAGGACDAQRARQRRPQGGGPSRRHRLCLLRCGACPACVCTQLNPCVHARTCFTHAVCTPCMHTCRPRWLGSTWTSCRPAWRSCWRCCPWMHSVWACWGAAPLPGSRTPCAASALVVSTSTRATPLHAPHGVPSSDDRFTSALAHGRPSSANHMVATLHTASHT
jgi:hypothetical protein